MNSNIEDVTRQLNSYDVDNMNLKNSIEIQNAETKSVIQNVENQFMNLEKEHRNDLIDLSELVDEIEQMEENNSVTLDKLREAHFNDIEEYENELESIHNYNLDLLSERDGLFNSIIAFLVNFEVGCQLSLN